jgi:hypothetical protein
MYTPVSAAELSSSQVRAAVRDPQTHFLRQDGPSNRPPPRLHPGNAFASVRSGVHRSGTISTRYSRCERCVIPQLSSFSSKLNHLLLMLDNKPTFRERNPPTAKGFGIFCDEINDLLRDMSLSMRRTVEQNSTERYWFSLVRISVFLHFPRWKELKGGSWRADGLMGDEQVNGDSGESNPDLAKAATDLSPLEISYFRAVVSHHPYHTPRFLWAPRCSCTAATSDRCSRVYLRI